MVPSRCLGRIKGAPSLRSRRGTSGGHSGAPGAGPADPSLLGGYVSQAQEGPRSPTPGFHSQRQIPNPAAKLDGQTPLQGWGGRRPTGRPASGAGLRSLGPEKPPQPPAPSRAPHYKGPVGCLWSCTDLAPFQEGEERSQPGHGGRRLVGTDGASAGGELQKDNLAGCRGPARAQIQEGKEGGVERERRPPFPVHAG